jgi:uncharacterized RDD family membrane protein YckC
VAFIIDLIVVQIVVLPVSFVILAMAGLAGRLSGDLAFRGLWTLGLAARAVFGGLVNWIYEAGMESSSRQATLGKMALGLKVTDIWGKRISFARATGRHFAKYLSGAILMIGYIMAAFTARKQALHDILAETLVPRT